MNKKQIFILIGVFLVIFLGIITIFVIIPSINSNKLVIGNFSLKYGLYEGIEKEYDPDLGKVIETKKELLLLNEDELKMGDTVYPFTIRGNKLYVYGTEYFEVTKNNNLTLVIGGGIDYEWKKEIREE